MAMLAALILVFDSGLLSPVTSQLSDETSVYLASVVGVGASVAPTELNTITAALTEREQELAEREAVLTERELAVGLNSGDRQASQDLSTYILSLLLFIILVLIILNYALDYARARELKPTSAA
jgi:hypothetical protein